ncbi:MAG: hypothetical protein ACUVT9_05300 [Candidatus Bathycorpusculaceae bacterium]
MQKKPENPSADIFQLLVETTEEERKKRRDELLAPLGITEFFVKGKVTIDKRICKGVECKLCIKTCPTNALFWRAGEVGMTEDLCIYCGACVINCIVDDCIKVVRERADGKVEKYSKPRDFIMLQNSINNMKRTQRVGSIFPKIEDYLRGFKTSTEK